MIFDVDLYIFNINLNPFIMNATINKLFSTQRDIIAFDNSEFDRPASISQLRKCDNVIVGDRVCGPKSPYQVLIEEGSKVSTIFVMPLTIHHPADGSTMLLLEVY